jgi:hypothetical protein
MPAKKPSVASQLALKELTRLKKAYSRGGKIRWEGSTDEERSEQMRKVALAKRANKKDLT